MRIFGSQAIDNNTLGYNFTIYCVENAGAADALKTIHFHIESEDGTVFYKPAELTDDAIVSSIETAIHVLDFSVTSNVTRSTATFNFDLSLLTA